MKFEIWSEGDPSVGIPGFSARVEIDNLEEWDVDAINATIENLETAFELIFDDTNVYVVEVTETVVEVTERGVIDR